jgi:hypothetical protein
MTLVRFPAYAMVHTGRTFSLRLSFSEYMHRDEIQVWIHIIGRSPHPLKASTQGGSNHYNLKPNWTAWLNGNLRYVYYFYREPDNFLDRGYLHYTLIYFSLFMVKLP